MTNAYVDLKLVEEKVFKDPIHRYIHVEDQLIWDLIKTKEFQRLRRIQTTRNTVPIFSHSRT